MEIKRILAATSEAFSDGNLGVEREEEGEEPHEYDVDGLLGDAVWDPE